MNKDPWVLLVLRETKALRVNLDSKVLLAPKGEWGRVEVLEGQETKEKGYCS